MNQAAAWEISKSSVSDEVRIMYYMYILIELKTVVQSEESAEMQAIASSCLMLESVVVN